MKKTKARTTARRNAEDGERTLPNVILFLADNMGCEDLSVYGCRYYKTPHLDALARTGTRFTNAYACAPMCTPSRVGLLTGRYPGRLQIGIQETLPSPSIAGDRIQIGLSEEVPTVASLLRDAGYETALIGKWHCGHLPLYSPLKSGFNEYFGNKTGSIDYFRHVDSTGQPDLWEGDERVSRKGYATELYSERAVEFIRRKRERPYFLCLWFNAPHWPWEGPKDKYLSDEIAGSDSHRTWIETGTAENYTAVVQSLDEGVGAVVKAVRKARNENNTLIMFSSDQGGDEMSHIGQLRRGRLHEAGIKVPLIASWPSVIRRNHVSRQIVVGFDVTATILAAAKASPKIDHPLDGESLIPITQGTKTTQGRPLFWRHWGNPRPGIPLQRALRLGNWKYLKVESEEYIFDLSIDPAETKDLKRRYPAKLKELRKAYRAWEAQMLPYDKAERSFRRVVFR